MVDVPETGVDLYSCVVATLNYQHVRSGTETFGRRRLNLQEPTTMTSGRTNAGRVRPGRGRRAEKSVRTTWRQSIEKYNPMCKNRVCCFYFWSRNFHSPNGESLVGQRGIGGKVDGGDDDDDGKFKRQSLKVGHPRTAARTEGKALEQKRVFSAFHICTRIRACVDDAVLGVRTFEFAVDKRP